MRDVHASSLLPGVSPGPRAGEAKRSRRARRRDRRRRGRLRRRRDRDLHQGLLVRGPSLAGRRLEARQQGAGVGEPRVELARGARPSRPGRGGSPAASRSAGRARRARSRAGRQLAEVARRRHRAAPPRPGRAGGVRRAPPRAPAPARAPPARRSRAESARPRPRRTRATTVLTSSNARTCASSNSSAVQRTVISELPRRSRSASGTSELVSSIDCPSSRDLSSFARHGPPQLLRALEQLLELTLPSPQVGQRGARLRPAVRRSSGERAHLEQLATRVDLELDQVGGDAVARLLEAGQLAGGVIAAHVNRRTAAWEGPGAGPNWPSHFASSCCHVPSRSSSARTPLTKRTKSGWALLIAIP